MSTELPRPTPLPSAHEDENPQGIPARKRPEWAADAIAFAALTAAGALAAFPVGALWRSTAPAVFGVVNQGNVYLSAPESKTFIGRDGWFAVYACIAAVLLALLAFLFFRKRASTGAALALVAGGFAGGYLATWFGRAVGPGGGSMTRAAHAVSPGTNFAVPLYVRATGVVWLWPAVAVGLFFFLMLLFGPSEPQSEQADFAGWGETPAFDGQPEPLQSPPARESGSDF